MILYTVFFLFGFLAIQSPKRLNFFSFIAALIPGLRNSAGKDTLLYMKRLQLIQENQIIWDYEPILSLIFYLSTILSKNIILSWFFSNFIYTLIVLALYNSILRRIKELRSYQTSIIISIFFIIILLDSAFNGMRVGLMIPFALYFLMTEKLSYMVFAFLSHFSAFFLIFFRLFKKYKIILLFTFISAFIFLDEIQNLITLNERINSKFIRYSQTPNANKFSGLIDLCVAFLLFLSANNKFNIRIILIIIFLVFVFFHIFILFEFYGFFRIYRLLIVFGIYLIYKQGVVNMKVLSLSCVIFIFNFIKQLVITYGDTGGFLPFK